MKAPIQFGKYYLLDRIAVGGMAEVFRAKSFGLEGSERIVALKRMLPVVGADKELVSMFIDEAKLAIQLNHPNICQVFDWSKVDESYYLAMEYVSGCDLRTVFQRCKQQQPDGATTMPLAQACFVVMKLCEGLDYAHNKKDPLGHDLGLVHRDVSPTNIMLSYEGEVKLIDFGIAKVQVERHAQTEAGVLKGKFAYMSPEQVQGTSLDRRSDIFSVGIVLYELVTGERLFPVDNELTSLEKIRNAEILPPSTVNRRVSEELERIVMKVLSRQPADRYATAMELHSDLQQFMYTSGEFYSRKELAAWMKRVFRSEQEAELTQLDAAREFRPSTPPTKSGSEPLARARATMSMAALRMPGDATGALRVPKDQAAAARLKDPTGAFRVGKDGDGGAPSSWTPGKSRGQGPGPGPGKKPGSTPPVAPRQSSTLAEAASGLASQSGGARPVALKGVPKPVGGKPLPAPAEEDTAVDGPGSGGRVSDPRFTDDSLATRPFEPQDQAMLDAAAREGQRQAGQSGELDEAPTRAFTPQSEGELGEPDGADTVLFTQSPEAIQPPAHARVQPSSGPPPAALPPIERPPARSGAGPAGSGRLSEPPSEYRSAPPVAVLPPPALLLPPTLDTPSTAPPPVKPASRIGLLLALAGLLLVAVAAYFLFGRAGELIVMVDPGRELIVLVDQHPVPINESPVRLRLQPGAHTVSVQHGGHSPWNDALNIVAGEAVVRNIRLEPVVHKTGGFTLVSEPPGAMVSLDGNSLNQVTPLRVQSLLVGPHALELRLGDRVWRQQITVEEGKSIELKATMPGATELPTVTTDRPTVTALDPSGGPGKPVAIDHPPTMGEPKEPAVKGPGPKVVQPNQPKGVALRGPRPKKRPGPTSDTPQPAAAAGNNGYLRINSRPWTKIIVDGLDTGLNTPQTSYRVAAGKHQITLFNPQFSIKETIVVTVAPGETQTITKIFQR